MEANQSTLRAEELLADSRWIRGIARSLVGDPAAADDLIQEAWVAALGREASARDEHGSHRPWLARVVRNLAAKHWRSSTRRAHREAECARRGTVASTADLVMRAEMQRLVVGAVLALAEPYRTTILLAYVEGSSSVDIARSQGVSENTVRWRIGRGLELLRFELERQRGREWLASCALLLPTADRAAALGAAKAAGACAGASASGNIAIAAVAVVALSSGAGLGLRGGLAPEDAEFAVADRVVPHRSEREVNGAGESVRRAELPAGEHVALLGELPSDPPLFGAEPADDCGRAELGLSVRRSLSRALGDDQDSEDLAGSMLDEIDDALSGLGLSPDVLCKRSGIGAIVAVDVSEIPPDRRRSIQPGLVVTVSKPPQD